MTHRFEPQHTELSGIVKRVSNEGSVTCKNHASRAGFAPD